MKTLLPNVNTSEGCFEIGVTISNPVFTEDAINKRKQERELLNKFCPKKWHIHGLTAKCRYR
ncbi:TPA: cell division inhibition protein DicB [Escherichia coli]|nr:cell division inhibition protein DicB [Escherichia coli]